MAYPAWQWHGIGIIMMVEDQGMALAKSRWCSDSHYQKHGGICTYRGGHGVYDTTRTHEYIRFTDTKKKETRAVAQQTMYSIHTLSNREGTSVRTWAWSGL